MVELGGLSTRLTVNWKIGNGGDLTSQNLEGKHASLERVKLLTIS